MGVHLETGYNNDMDEKNDKDGMDGGETQKPARKFRWLKRLLGGLLVLILILA